MGKEIYYERVFASHPKQNVRHLLPDYPVLIPLTARALLHGVLFILTFLANYGLLYSSSVLSSNKINTAQILLQDVLSIGNNATGLIYLIALCSLHPPNPLPLFVLVYRGPARLIVEWTAGLYNNMHVYYLKVLHL